MKTQWIQTVDQKASRQLSNHHTASNHEPHGQTPLIWYSDFPQIRQSGEILRLFNGFLETIYLFQFTSL